MSGLIFFITARWIKGLPIEKTEPHDILGSLGPLRLKDSDSMNADNSHKDLFGPFDYTLGLLGFLILERVPCLGNTWIHLCSGTLEKILESPLDSKEIKAVSPKGNQPWIFIGRTNAEAEAPIIWQPDAKSWLTGKDPDAGKDWGQEEKGMTEDEMVGWHHWLSGQEKWRTGKPGLHKRLRQTCLWVSECLLWRHVSAVEPLPKRLIPVCRNLPGLFSQYPWPRSGHCGLRPPPETPDTHRQVWLSLLWGRCSFLLDPGMLKVLFVPSKSLFPQSCGSSIIKSYWPSKSNFLVGSLSLFQILRLWNLLVGPRTFVTQQELLWYNCPPVCGSPARRLYSGANVNLLQEEGSQLHLSGPLLPEPLGLQQATADTQTGDTQTLKGRSVSVSCGGHCSFPWIRVHTRFCLCPLSITGKYELWFKMWLHPSYHLAAAYSLPLDGGYLFLVGSYILLTSTFSCQWLFSN